MGLQIGAVAYKFLTRKFEIAIYIVLQKHPKHFRL